MKKLDLTLTACLALIALLGFAACSSTGEGASPELAPSKVVYLSHVTAAEAAEDLCGRFAQDAGPGRLEHPGCRYVAADGSTRNPWIIVTPEPQTNALVIAATAGHAKDLERALEIVREIDVPKSSSQ